MFAVFSCHAIEQTIPGSIRAVNEERFYPFINCSREFDIITKKCIIEVKGGKKPNKALKQFLGQKRYSESNRKNYIVFAPQMPTMARIAHRKNGINIISDYQSLVAYIKEHEK